MPQTPKGSSILITDNLWKDWIRRDKRQPPALPWSDETFNQRLSDADVEMLAQRNWTQHRLRSLCWQLPDEKAHLTLLLFLTGLSTRQISWLVPWSESTVARYIEKARHTFKFLFNQAPEYEVESGTWDRLLTFPDGRGDLGVTFTNASPRHFSKETELDLCKQLGLRHIDQLNQGYRSFIVIRSAYTADPQIHLCFAPREPIGLSLLHGATLEYVYDGLPLFQADVEGSKINEKLHLVEVSRYKAWVVNVHDEVHNGLALLDWHYDIPGNPLHLRKLLNTGAFEKNKADLPTLTYFSSRPISVDCCIGSQPASIRASS